MGITKFIEKVSVQTAVYWAPAGNTGYGETYAVPVEIKCRWDGKLQKVINKDGEEVISRAELILVNDVEVGGFLFLGDLDDLDSGVTNNPREQEGAYQILQFLKFPLFKSTDKFIRQAFL